MIVGGGPEPHPESLRGPWLSQALVIAADGGWRLCRTLGLVPRLLVGDMDTLTPDEVALAGQQGTEIRRFPLDKDQSDLELAIDAAAAMGARQLTFLGALGGQWDHCIANLLAPLGLCDELGIWARLMTVGAEIYLLRAGRYEMRLVPGTRVSLSALSATVDDVSLAGFLYPLAGQRLSRHRTVTLANQVTEARSIITIGRGELLLTIVRET